MTTFKTYKKSWKERARREEASRESLRQEALNVAGQLAQILARDYSVSRVILFGSVLAKGRFQEDSDVDIAVEGLPKADYFPALARLMRESPFAVDLKPVEEVNPLLRQRITRGMILYEKRPAPRADF